VVDKPTGAAAGDGVTIDVYFNAAVSTLGTVVVPTGFETRSNAGAHLVLTKTLDGTEGATFTVSWDMAIARAAICCHALYDDAGGTVHYDSAAGVATYVANNTSHSVGPITVTFPRSVLVVAAGHNTNPGGTFAPGGSLVEQAEVQVGATAQTGVWLATEAQAAAGASGTKSFTTSASLAVRATLLAFYARKSAQPVNGGLVNRGLINGGLVA
jgi:hypothetical protein